jgi:hypothetical protein
LIVQRQGALQGSGFSPNKDHRCRFAGDRM